MQEESASRRKITFRKVLEIILMLAALELLFVLFKKGAGYL